MARGNINGMVAGSCCCGLCCILLSLGLTTGAVFLSFYIGWSVQQTQFLEQKSALADNFSALFAIPAVAEPWPVFSCFLYGALILIACSLGLALLLMCISCCGFGAAFLRMLGDDREDEDGGEWTQLKMPTMPPHGNRSYNSFAKVSIVSH